MNRERLFFQIRGFTCVGILVFALSLTGCGGGRETNAIQATLTPTRPSMPESIPTGNSVPTTILSTDWHVCGMVQPGWGVIETLRQNSTSGEPHEWSNGGLQQIIEIRRSDGTVETYTWEELLRENPIVYPGDEVCDTLIPRLSATATAEANKPVTTPTPER